MRDDMAGVGSESIGPTWEVLEGWVRERAQALIQGIPEEEVAELLGREKSDRKRAVGGAAGYRNGYGKPRRLARSSETITVRRPRVRGLEERFASRALPLFLPRTREVGALLPELYLNGLAEGDFELAMRGLLGEGVSSDSLERPYMVDTMDKPPDDAPKVSAFAGGMLRNGITAGSAAAILMTLLVELTKAQRERIEMKLEISVLPRIREFLKGVASRCGWDGAMLHRLDAASEETLLALLEDEGEGAEPRHLRLTA